MTTTNDLAEQTGNARITIQKWCERLRFAKIGRDYILTDEEVSLIKSRIQSKRGRPKRVLGGLK